MGIKTREAVDRDRGEKKEEFVGSQGPQGTVVLEEEEEEEEKEKKEDEKKEEENTIQNS
jgi:hypothetical protein